MMQFTLPKPRLALADNKPNIPRAQRKHDKSVFMD